MSGLPVNFNLGQFRKLVEDLPDETELFIEFEDCSEYREIGEFPRFFPASLGVPPALILSGGQKFDEDRYLLARLDAYLQNGVGWSLPKRTFPSGGNQ